MNTDRWEWPGPRLPGEGSLEYRKRGIDLAADIDAPGDPRGDLPISVQLRSLRLAYVRTSRSLAHMRRTSRNPAAGPDRLLLARQERLEAFRAAHPLYAEHTPSTAIYTLVEAGEIAEASLAETRWTCPGWWFWTRFVDGETEVAHIRRDREPDGVQRPRMRAGWGTWTIDLADGQTYDVLARLFRVADPVDTMLRTASRVCP